MASSRRGGRLKERMPTRSANRLGGGMVGRVARNTGRSDREESTRGWGTAMTGVAASILGAVIGMAAARRRQARRAT